MPETVSIRRSLITRLIALVLLTTGALALIVAIGAYRAGDDVAREFVHTTADDIHDEAMQMARQVAGSVNVLQDWVESGEVKASDFESLNPLFLPLLLRNEVISSLLIADSAGHGYMILRDPLESHLVTNRFIDPDVDNGVPRIRIWNRNTGEVTETSGDPGYDPRTRLWFKGAVEKKGELYWTRPTIFYTTKDPGMTASMLVHPSDGSPSTVVAFDVLLLDISKFTANATVGRGGAAFVVIEDSLVGFRVIGLPRQAGFQDVPTIRDAFRNAAANDSQVDAEPNLPVPSDFAFPPMESSLRTWVELGRPEESFKFEYEGHDWWSALEPLRLADQTLLIGVAEPEEDFLSAATRDMIIIGLVGLLGILVAVGIAFATADSYARPLESLAASSRRIRDLDLERAIPVQSNLEEVRNLAEEQDLMRVTLGSFAKYIPVTLVRELIDLKQAAKIGGANRTITILFTDIQNFTTVSERLKPEEIALHMSEYFDVLLDTVERHGGEVIQMLGDGIMAFWGAPRDDEDHALHAAHAVIDFNARLVDLNRDWEEVGKPALPTRFGLNTGEVMVGNVGSKSRLTYTAIGDDINLASRIEGINKYYGTRLMASGETRQVAGDSIEWRHVDKVRVKGKKLPIDLFEPLGPAGDVDMATTQLRDDYEKALKAFQDRRFDQAKALLEQLLSIHDGDGPSQRLLKLTVEFLSTPPPPEWDGVSNFDVK